MQKSRKTSRREMLARSAAGLGAMALGSTLVSAAPQASGIEIVGEFQGAPAKLRGRIKQAVCRWCYNKTSLDTLAKEAAAMGIKGVDLIGPEDWPTVQKYGLTPTMVTGGGTIPDGLNRLENHDKIVKEFEQNIPRAAKAGVPNVITFSGNKRGMDERQAIENCITGLNRVKKLAEEHGVTICLEYLNSKVDHKDYQFDHMSFGTEVIKRVNSPRVKILYDIYHAQIMEGDVIRTIKNNIQHIGHFHTGGVPGRHEIDETQELYYPAIVKAIIETGYTGYMAHEFVPVREALKSLSEAVKLCDV
jgi:hydroxypyruvate isomerase